MTAFKKLKTIREFEKARMPHLRSHEDFDIVIEVGYHEDMGEPLTLKCLLLIGIASAATVQRRVHTLVDAGILTRTRRESDRRRRANWSSATCSCCTTRARKKGDTCSTSSRTSAMKNRSGAKSSRC